VVIFFSSACIMVIELVAGRLIARHLGSSLYTWTTIIGVVLAGMSIGNYVGGRLADRFRPASLLGWLFLLASVLCAASLFSNRWFASGDALAFLKWLLRTDEVSWVARIVAAVVVVFLPPALLLGTISPAVAKMALERSRRVGATLGSVYAWGAVGSIVGTFITGFWLIAALGATGVVLATSFGLAVIGLAVWRGGGRSLGLSVLWALAAIVIWSPAAWAIGRAGGAMGPAEWAVLAVAAAFTGAVCYLAVWLRSGAGRWLCATWLGVLAVALVLAKGSPDWKLLGPWIESARPAAFWLGLRDGYESTKWDASLGRWVPDGWREYRFAKESQYQFVRVEDSRVDGRPIRMLVLDYLIHGYIDPDEPSHLQYSYELVYRDVARRYAARADRLDTLFLGGGSYTFPRWVLAEWPGSTADVAEIDPVVPQANHAALELAADTPIRTTIGDARNVVDDLPADRKYDFIFGDAFSDLSVPFHLTTLEFSRKVASHLKPGGAYLVNIIDDWRFARFLGAYVATLEKVFKHVYVFTTSVNGVQPGRETFVVAASDVELDITDWLPAPDAAGEEAEVRAAAFAGSALTYEDLCDLAQRNRGRILTDDDAPVENLLAPVVRTRQD
jgi:spermidine synthase